MMNDQVEPDVSLVISTRNRARALDACLRAVAALDYPSGRWELVIVDNGSSDHTSAVVRQFAASVPFHVRLVSEPKPGLARARNAGVRMARAKIVAFTDDDCYAERDYLTTMVSAFQHGGYGYIGGRILLHDPTDARATIKEDTTPEDMPPRSVVPAGFIHGANFAVRRIVWEQIRGFDEMLGAGTRFAAEDVDFVGRASAAGWLGGYRPRPTVRHHHGRKPGNDVAKLKATYVRGIAAYLVKGCLNPPVRIAFFRYWYWHVLSRLRQGHYADLLRELAGAFEYLAKRVVTRQST